MAFTKLKNHISNLATPFAANAINNFMSGGSAQAAGKVAAKLKDKSPFNIDSAPSQKLIENPLSFSPVQYPLDLGSNELGHYIIFESGFIGYSPQQGGMFNSGKKKGKKVTSKVPNKSIMNSAIALYMPSSIKASYSQDYGAEETGISGDIEGALMRNASGGESADQIKAFLSAGTNTAIKKGKQLLGEAVQLVGLGDPIKFMMKRAGTAINPRNELFYEGPGMRDFTYTFDFWPRNMKEADAVRDIITIFKYNSAPGFKAGTLGSVFTTPNYWKISYMFNSEENMSLNKIGACYCTDVEIDYSPDGQWTTFGDGKPVHTRMTVNMLEDRIITKQDIEQGA